MTDSKCFVSFVKVCSCFDVTAASGWSFWPPKAIVVNIAMTVALPMMLLS